ncbi:DUF4352 domain-containing protein [Neobacillus soli]|uniref:DUF4352 domain-containing protein n=1 Tax=Neobacillus soli TaxID=220688 RepID=UPI001F31604D|nr:DUF4352 domain-containing protein [Neobacillus soli]
MFICPICKEANEGYRNYCKKCGTWMLSTTFPSKSIEKQSKKQSSYSKKTANNHWVRNLFMIGTILFVLLVLLSGKELIYSWLALFGVAGFGLSIILAIVFAITRSFTERRGGLGFLLVFSVLSIITSIALTPKSLEAANPLAQAGKVNSGPAIPVKKQNFDIGDKVSVGKLTYIVKDVFQQKKIDGPFDTLTTDEVFLVMTIHVSNNDKQPRYVDKSMFKLHDSQGRSFGPDTKADSYINNETAFFLKSINPGISTEAKIVFELPHNAKQLKLEVTSGFGLKGKESQLITIGSL